MVKEFHAAFPPTSPRFDTPESKERFRVVVATFLSEIESMPGGAFKFELFQDLYSFILEANCFTLASSPRLTEQFLKKISSIRQTNKYPDRKLWLEETETKLHDLCQKVEVEYKNFCAGVESKTSEVSVRGSALTSEMISPVPAPGTKEHQD